jgi:nucleoside-diphosphate-sugar epimerase
VRVLILGGTRFFGREIVAALAARGHEVTALTRGQTAPDLPAGVRHVARDRADRAGFEGWLRGERFDAIVDNIAYDAEDVRSVVRAAGGRVGHYLLTSTGSVYHQPYPRHPIREDEADLAFTGDGAYGEGKRRAELVLRDEAADAFPWTVIRPRVVLGPRDYTLREWWYTQRVLDGGPLLLPTETADAEISHTYARDLAQIYAAALGNPVAHGRAYNGAQPDLLSSRAFIREIGRALGREPEVVAAPVAVLRAALPGYAPPLTRAFSPCDITAARCDLGFRPTPLADWLGETARWSAAHRAGTPSTGYDRRADEVALARRYRDRLAALTAEFTA